MKCPACDHKAISFTNWMQGIKAFKTQCQHCDTQIKANTRVYLGFIITLACALALTPYLSDITAFLKIELEFKALSLLLLLPVVTTGAVITWFLGGYKISIS